MSEALDRLSREFRSAVLAGDHELSQRLVSEYAAAVRDLWESLAEQERAASDIPKTACELLVWAHQMTVIQRAMAAEQLAAIQKASRYTSAASGPTSSTGVQVKG